MFNARTGLALIVILLVGFTGYYLGTLGGDEVSTELNEPTSAAENSSAENTPQSSESELPDVKNQTAEQSETQETSTPSSSISITRTSYSETSVTVSAILSGIGSGSCTAVVADSTSQVSGTADTLSTNGTTGCTVTVETSSLTAQENWSMVMSATDGNQNTETETTLSAEDR